MSSTLYLEHYLDSLASLPEDLRRNFTLMYDLDKKNKVILQEVDAASDEYLRKVRELSPDQRRAEMEKIQTMFSKAKNYGDDKVAIAIQTYELVDKHIRRLDADLAKFEAEMKEKGRLSQTETEEEEEEPDDTTKKRKKKEKNAKGAGAGRGKKAGNKAAAAAVAAAAASDKEEKKRGKKKGASAAASGAGAATASAEPGGGGLPLPPGMLPVPQEVLDMPVDPNEPTYCLCQQVSYGEMIGCDNADCPIEWFHFGCMNLTTKPKGKWYCPKCIVLFKKKK